MKRICNYLLFKIETTKLLVFSTILVIYQFSLLFYLISDSRKYNIYDFIMKNFSYLSLFYSINLFFLIMIYNIFDKKSFYNYLSIRFNSKQEIYRGNVLSAFVFSIGIVVFINIICILLGSFMSFNNSWTPYFFYTMTGHVNLSYDDEAVKLIVQKLTPISLVLMVCTIYFAFGTSIGVICTSIVNKDFNLNGIGVVFKTIGLLSLSSYYIITVYIFGILVSRKHNQSFLVLIATLLLSITFGDILKIDKYIPFNQGILSKHIISHFSYQWSFIFLAILITVNLIFINRLIVKRDLFEIAH